MIRQFNNLNNTKSAFSAGYYPDGKRAWKLIGATKTYYVYDGDTLLYELSSAGTATNLFAYGAAGLAQRRATSTSTTFNYSFDPSGNVVQRHTAGASTLADFTTLYDGFGQQMGCIDTITGSQASAASGEMIGFSGQYGCWTDNETYTTASSGAPQRRFPWVWMGHREYDPLAARFLTRDPIDYDGGINLYAYCGNNPIMFADPSGHQTTFCGLNASDFYKAAGCIEIVGGGPLDPFADAIAGGSLIIGASMQLQDWMRENSWRETERQWKLNHKDDAPPNKSPAGAKRGGALRAAKRDLGIPKSQNPDKILPNKDKRGNPQPGEERWYGNKVIRDDSGGHNYGSSDPQNRGPHFNTGIFDPIKKEVIDTGMHYDY